MKNHPPKPGDTTIEISSGQYLDLANPDPEMITLEVVAHHLAQEVRYGGAPRRVLPVAEHAVLVASYLRHNLHPANVQLAGLHHDDPEAFLKDIPRPLKEMIKPLYDPIERRMENAVAEAFAFAELHVNIHDPAVVQADNWALSAEAWYHMPTQGLEWWCAGLYDAKDPNNPTMIKSPVYSVEMPRRDIELLWVKTHKKLVAEISQERVGNVNV